VLITAVFSGKRQLRSASVALAVFNSLHNAWPLCLIAICIHYDSNGSLLVVSSSVNRRSPLRPTVRLYGDRKVVHRDFGDWFIW